LVGEYRGFRRAAHLRPVPLPGGDTAAREPWRVALAHLLEAGEGSEVFAGRIEPGGLPTVAAVTERGADAALSFRGGRLLCAGRLLDAVAALVGLRDRIAYEGQAAIELEGLASLAERDGISPFALDPVQVDTRPLIAAIASDVRAGVSPAVIARRFHSTLVEI